MASGRMPHQKLLWLHQPKSAVIHHDREVPHLFSLSLCKCGTNWWSSSFKLSDGHCKILKSNQIWVLKSLVSSVKNNKSDPKDNFRRLSQLHCFSFGVKGRDHNKEKRRTSTSHHGCAGAEDSLQLLPQTKEVWRRDIIARNKRHSNKYFIFARSPAVLRVCLCAKERDPNFFHLGNFRHIFVSHFGVYRKNVHSGVYGPWRWNFHILLRRQSKSNTNLWTLYFVKGDVLLKAQGLLSILIS